MENKKINFKYQNYSDSQWQFLKSDAKFLALVTGYGGGKTYVFLRKCLRSMILNVGEMGKSVGYVIYPTYNLGKELFWEPFQDLLEMCCIPCKSNTQDSRISTDYGDVYMKTLEKPEKIVGGNLSWVGFDEFDIASYKNAMIGYNKAIGRMRLSPNPQLFIVTTPEGYRQTWEIFQRDYSENKTERKKQLKKHDKELIKGSTLDNRWLSDLDGYVNRLKSQYSKELVMAYVHGEFVNMSQSGVFQSFDRDVNIREIDIDYNKPVYVSCDFNINHCIWTLAIVDGRLPIVQSIDYNHDYSNLMIYVFDEVYIETNASTIEMTRILYDKLKRFKNNIVITGDASAKARRLSSESDFYMMIETLKSLDLQLDNVDIHSRLITDIPSSNPLIRPTIVATNTWLEQKKIIVSKRCEELILDLEQVCYNDRGDIDKTSNLNRTHASDTLRYLVNLVAPIGIKNIK